MEHGIAQCGHGLRAGTCTDAAVVLAKDHVAAPVQAVLDQPVVAPERQQGVGIGLLGREAGHRVGDLTAHPALRRADPLDPADLGGPRPAEMGHALAADAQTPRLDATVPFLDDRRAEGQVGGGRVRVDTRSPAVLLGEGLIGFSRPRGLQRGVFLWSTRREQPARGARTLLLECAGFAVRTGEADARHRATQVVIGAPSRRGVTGRTSGDLAIPVDLKVLKPEGSRLTRLPLRILRARPEQRHGVIACTGEQQVRINVGGP